jgi:hypothetical protein
MPGGKFLDSQYLVEGYRQGFRLSFVTTYFAFVISRALYLVSCVFHFKNL